MLRTISWLGLVAVGLVACGSDASCPVDSSGSPASVQALIGEEGGNLELVGGGKVEIPAGALSEPTMIKITEISEPTPLPLGLDAAGKAIAFEPHGTVFSTPIKLTVPFSGDAAEVRPMKLDDEDDTSWETVLTNVDKTPGKLELETTSFSVYIAARPRRNSGVVVLPDGAVVLPGTDASTDASTTQDAGVDADVADDAGFDAGEDSGVDAGIDAGPVCDPLIEACATGAMTQLVAGYDSLCALYESGVVYCWGSNSYGETGQGVQGSPRAPGLVQYFTGVNLTDVEQISTHPTGRHVCAVRTDGSVVCWGDNANGKSGATAPATALRAYPVAGVAGAVHVSAGTDQTCAVLGTGRVLCWGLNASGQLGNGDTATVASSAATPMLEVEVQSGGNVEITDAIEVAAGRNLTCVLHSGRQKVSCTGRNTTGGGHVGMLGRGLSAAQYTSAGPALLPPGFTVDSMTMGNTLYGSPVCLVSSDGGAPLCWGYNEGYIVGGASVLIAATPTRLDPYYAMPQQVAVGSGFLCVTYVHPNFGPRVGCHGYDSAGQLGRGTVGGASVSVPNDVVTATDPVAYLDGAEVEMMVAGNNFVCAKVVASGVTCWGANPSQIRGDTSGNQPFANLNATVPGLPSETDN